MKSKHIPVAVIAFAAICQASVTSCDDTTSPIGESIVEDQISITVDSSFTVSGQPIANSAVQSRTLLQIIGKIEAGGYGSLSSDVVTQFMPSSSLDTTGITVNDIDSIKLMMQIYHGNFVGDSITPMGFDIYRLNRNLPSPIYSDFNPEEYYDPSQKLATKIYNTSTLGDSDSLRNATYHTLTVKLPRELAQELYTAYEENPSNFSSPSTFVDNVFKGIYIKNSYGSGRLTLVSNSLMRVYYHRNTTTDEDNDTTIYAMANYFAVTPEIITNNNIDLSIAPTVKQQIDNGENIVVSPAGYDVEFTFPTKEIIDAYNSGKGTESAINSLTFSLPVDSVDNEFGFGPAPYMLMILKSKKAEFFQNNSLPDNITSFYAEYDASYQRYSFASMRSYLMEMLSKENITADDVTFVLTPVYISTETNENYYYGTSTTVTAVTPYITTPTLTKILFDKAKIRFTYSNQTTNY